MVGDGFREAVVFFVVEYLRERAEFLACGFGEWIGEQVACSFTRFERLRAVAGERARPLGGGRGATTGASRRVDDRQGRCDGQVDGRTSCRPLLLTEDHVVDRRVDRRHDHPCDQGPPLWIVDSRRQKLGREIDQLRPRSLELEVDLVGAGCAMHDEEMQLVELVLVDEEVDDTAEDDVDTRFAAQSAQQIGESGSGGFDVPLGERDQERVLVREVLVERPDRDLCLVGDVVGGGPGVSLLVEDASRRIEDAFDCPAGPLLTWGLAGGDG